MNFINGFNFIFFVQFFFLFFIEDFICINLKMKTRFHKKYDVTVKDDFSNIADGI